MVYHQIEKEKKKRKFYSRFEEKRKIVKSLVFNSFLPPLLRWKASFKLSSFPRHTSLTRVKKRCIVTGRGRFILGKFNLSGLSLRKYASTGMVAGLRKSSW